VSSAWTKSRRCGKVLHPSAKRVDFVPALRSRA
jgi:hypothetical protein